MQKGNRGCVTGKIGAVGEKGNGDLRRAIQGESSGTHKRKTTVDFLGSSLLGLQAGNFAS
jgi:hypothetical protein